MRRLTVLLDHVGPADGEAYREEMRAYRADMEAALAGLGFDGVDVWTDHDDLPRRLRGQRPEFVLHLAEYGYKGSRSLYCCQIPALLERMGVPYSNAGAPGMVFSSDKHLLNEVLRDAGLRVPRELLLHRDDILAGAARVAGDFPFPAFLKTRLNGGSVGIAGDVNILAHPDQLAPALRAIDAAFSRDDVRGENVDEWLLQEYLPGPEYSVAVIGNGDALDVLPIGRLGTSGGFLTYEDSAEVETAETHAAHERYVPADLPPAEAQALRDAASRAYALLACRDYARFDFRRSGAGILQLIDANALPGIYRGSAFVLMAAMRGWSFADIWRAILHACFDRCFPGWRIPPA